MCRETLNLEEWRRRCIQARLRRLKSHAFRPFADEPRDLWSNEIQPSCHGAAVGVVGAVEGDWTVVTSRGFVAKTAGRVRYVPFSRCKPIVGISADGRELESKEYEVQYVVIGRWRRKAYCKNRQTHFVMVGLVRNLPNEVPRHPAY